MCESRRQRVEEIMVSGDNTHKDSVELFARITCERLGHKEKTPCANCSDASDGLVSDTPGS